MNWLQDRFELNRGAESRLLAMEGLRGFAVIVVFFVHYVTLIDPWIPSDSSLRPFAESLRDIGNVGVDLFFVLSGYLIYGSVMGRKQPFIHFMARRAERIYPTFTAVFTIYLFLSILFPSESKIPATLAASMWYLLQNFLLLPGLFSIEPLITVAWSLSYEMFYYLMAPAMVGGLGLQKWHADRRIALFLALVVGVIVYGVLYGGHVRLIMFISGILLYEVQKGEMMSSPRSVTTLAVLLVGLLGMLLPTQGSVGYTMKICILFVSFFILCHACFVGSGTSVAWLFSLTPIRWLGNMSYSYYLIHGLTLKLGFLVFATIWSVHNQAAMLFWGLLPVMFVLTLITSASLFLVIERPCSLSSSRKSPKRDNDKITISTVLTERR